MTIYYLYVKTHNKTGLKYLGYTSSKDPHKYPGSGIYWKNHLKVHGLDYSTTIIEECTDKTQLRNLGLYYSNLWDVVESEQWANLGVESGEGGPAGIKRSAEFSANLSARKKGSNNPMYGKTSAFKGKSHTEQAKLMQSQKRAGRAPHNKGKKMPPEYGARIAATHHDVKGDKNPMYGKTQSDYTKHLISQKRQGQKASDETKANLSKIRKGKPWTEARRAAHEARKSVKGT